MPRSRPIHVFAFVFVLLTFVLLLPAPARSQSGDVPAGCVFNEKPGTGAPACPDGRAKSTVTYADISSAGPLTHIFAGVEASAQVAHALDGTTYEFYPPSTIPGDAGTFLVVDGALYAPRFAEHGRTATGNLGSYTSFTTVSQTAVQGAGTAADPYRVTTVVAAGNTGLRIIQTDTYQVGLEAYRTDVQVSNSSGAAHSIVLYRAGDCYLGASDFGYGMVTPGVGAVACTKTPNNNPEGRILQYVPLTGGSRYYEARYSEVWSWIGSKQVFPNTCRCADNIDNGAGLSWSQSLPAGGQVTWSHMTAFSPLGSLPLTLQKTADAATSTPGAENGYSVIINNPNASPVTVTSIKDTLPTGFVYKPNSTSGLTVANPAVSGRDLTWNGAFVVPGGGTATLHFGVAVTNVPGIYANSVSAVATNYAVSSAVNVAPVTVTIDIEPIAIDFIVDEDGYSFENFGLLGMSDYTQADMVLMFGEEATCAYSLGPVCFLKPAAILWHANVQTKLVGGRCLGMTVSALRFFTGIDEPSTFQSGAQTVHALEKGNARNNLTWHHVLQFAPNISAGQWVSTPNYVLQSVYQSMTYGGTELPNLLLLSPDGKQGHSVLPYALEYKGNGKWWIKVYDNNSQDDENRHIEIDTMANTFSTNLADTVGTWTGSASNLRIGAPPLDLYLQSPECPWCGTSGSRAAVDTLSVMGTDTSSLLITDDDGRRIGYVGSQSVNEIPGALAWPTIGGLGISSEPMYSLPTSGNYSIDIRSTSARATIGGEVSIFGPGFAMAVENMTLASGSAETLAVAGDGTRITFTATQLQDVALLLTGGPSENEQYRIADVEVGPGQRVALQQNEALRQVVVNYSEAGSGQYNLELTEVSSTGSSVFVHRGIPITSGDSHVVKLDTLGNDSVEVCTDRGSNGSLDDCRELNDDGPLPTSTTIFLPITAHIPYIRPALPLLNGNFESGPVNWAEVSSHGWPIILSNGDVDGLPTHSGSWSAWLGGEYDEISYVEQTVTVPAGRPFLTYYHAIGSDDYCGYDFGGVIVNDTVVDQYDLCANTSTSGWAFHAVDLSAYAGQDVALQIRVETDDSINSNLFVDDVAFSGSGAVRLDERPVPFTWTMSRAALPLPRGAAQAMPRLLGPAR